MSKFELRSNYQVFEKGSLICEEASLAVQSSKDECDVNHIMRRFESTGQLPQLIKQNPLYGDFSNVPDYQQACNIVIHAETQFAALDARVRERFQNDPSKFLAFVADPASAEELVKMGLANLRQVAPEAVPVGHPSPSGGSPSKKVKAAKGSASKGVSGDE